MIRPSPKRMEVAREEELRLVSSCISKSRLGRPGWKRGKKAKLDYLSFNQVWCLWSLTEKLSQQKF